MTIQCIEFEDRGQDLTWWEIDMETGRVVGCGPHQAHYWAGGKVSVDVGTISIGARPRIYTPASGPEGVRLKYEIVDIRQAETGDAA